MRRADERIETLSEDRVTDGDLEHLPSVVRDAILRAGAGAKCSVAKLQSSAAARPVVPVSPDTHRRACAQAVRGEYYCYMATHPIADRKKNTFIGVSTDPVNDLYVHNHAMAFVPMRRGRVPAHLPVGMSTVTRETHSSAPYWSLASVVGPFLTRAEADHVRRKWHDKTRGEDSKRRRAHTLAEAHRSGYYGSDVELSRTDIGAYIHRTLGAAAGSIFESMCRALDDMTGRSREAPHSSADATQDECCDDASGDDDAHDRLGPPLESLIRIPARDLAACHTDITRPVISFVRPVH